MNTNPHIITLPTDSVERPLHEVLASHVAAAVAGPMLARGGIWLDGVRVNDGATPVPPGALLVLRYPPAEGYREVELTDADLLYEDAWIVALHKRAGWYSGATPWDTQGNALAAVGRFLARRDGVKPPLHLAHQLDRDTSGVLLISRNPEANAPLYKAFSSSTIEKVYRCVCTGEPTEDAFELRTGHGRGASGRWRVYPLEEIGQVLPGGSRVKLAHSLFHVERRLGGAALVTARLHTGRTHQIRLHMAAAGYSLLGDTRYGGPASFGGQHVPFHMLHAEWLRLNHPLSGERLELHAPLPAHFKRLGIDE
ncbi:MAG: RluA family pseudouridine synthase [Chloroflexaceae bacterium]|nr:RluA family pseudouridine synthase [Chloroflexaceae bacterium]